MCFSTKAYLLDPDLFFFRRSLSLSCFYVEVNAEKSRVRFKYSISLHVKDLALLELNVH